MLSIRTLEGRGEAEDILDSSGTPRVRVTHEARLPSGSTSSDDHAPVVKETFDTLGSPLVSVISILLILDPETRLWNTSDFAGVGGGTRETRNKKYVRFQVLINLD